MNDQIDKPLTPSKIKPTETTMGNLRGQLKLYLEYRGITAAELSRESGISRQVISSWLSGAQPKKIEQVKKIAVALKTTIDDLCFGHGIDKENQKITELDALLGDAWVSGLFEVRFRRVKK